MGVNIVFEIDPTTQMSLYNYLINIDKSKFTQVIRNLISNALKFSPSGGTVIVRLKMMYEQVLPTTYRNSYAIQAVDSYNYVQLSVIDQGAGISEVSTNMNIISLIVFIRLNVIIYHIIGQSEETVYSSNSISSW